MSHETKKQLGIWGILGIGILIGYVAASSKSETSTSQAQTLDDRRSRAVAKRSPTGTVPDRDTYFPGTERLDADHRVGDRNAECSTKAGRCMLSR
jgi:hypothetical protein